MFSALALAITPFISTAPVYAADDNTVSIAVDQNAALQPTGTLYKATTSITVKTGKPYGFNLTMQADTADLVNSKDSTHKISATPSATPVALNANQWGYSLSKSATTFSAVPATTQTGVTATPAVTQPSATATIPAVIADVTKAKPAGCTNPANCTKSVTFAANINPAKLASGSYSTAITYTATAKPAPAPTVDPTTCKSGDPKNDCQVDLDPNMIPVKYTGTTTNAQWTSLEKSEDSSNQGNWYNYNQKQWANAVTVKDPSKYKNQTRVVDQSDILGYWVYIPRYAYEVMRRDGIDKPVSAQNFLIHFEKKTDAKRRPAACSTTGKDYRTQCDLDRSYIKGQPSNTGTWATHPAFTFGIKELNGIWFAKFETTGTTTQPTVLPNEVHISSFYSGMNQKIGNFYSLAKTLGINDPQNVGGGDFTTTQNNHHLAKLSSHMVNNNDWGAAAYLSASKYGAGYNGVQINSQNGDRNNGNGGTTGITGCGPWENGNTDTYSSLWTEHHNISVGAFGTQQACSSDGAHAYNGALGQLASTTNNPTGIYDMSGGAWEYTAASYSDNLNNSNTQRFGLVAHPPYVNTYNITDMNSCTFATCGGQALYETNNGGRYSGVQWNGNSPYFVVSSSPWFMRGGISHLGSFTGIFYAADDAGGATNDYNYGYAFRVALAPAPDPPKPKFTNNLYSADGDSLGFGFNAEYNGKFIRSNNFDEDGNVAAEYTKAGWRTVSNTKEGDTLRLGHDRSNWPYGPSSTWFNYNKGRWAYAINIKDASVEHGTGRWYMEDSILDNVFSHYNNQSVNAYLDKYIAYVMVPKIDKVNTLQWSYGKYTSDEDWINLSIICPQSKFVQKSQRRFRYEATVGQYDEDKLKHAIRELTPVIGTPCPDGSMPKL